MAASTPVGSCRSCGAALRSGAPTCPSCGRPVAASGNLAERVPATRVYGAPPSVGRQGAPPAALADPESDYGWLFAPDPGPDRGPGSRPQPGLDPNAGVASEQRRERRRRDLLVGAVIALALVLGSIWAYTYFRDRPVREALDASSSTYSRLLDALSSATDLSEVRDAGAVAQDVAAELAATEATLAGHDSDLGIAARTMVQSQQQVARAATQLTGLTRQELGLWGIAERDLAEARTALTAARNDLADIDGDEALPIADPAKAIDNVRTIVGGSAREVLTASVDDLVSRLGEVDTTAQVRRLAKEAENEAAVAEAARSGLSGENAVAVEAAGSVLELLSALRALDGDHLGVWGDQRTALVAALGNVPLQGFRSQANRSVDHLDALVTHARSTLERWRDDLARAKRKQQRARATLATYSAAVGEQLTTYQALRSELSAFVAQVEAGEHIDDPAGVLLSAATARRDIAIALRDIVPPGAVLAEHDELKDVVRHAMRVVLRAYGGLRFAYYCHFCDYGDSESYLALSEGSARISEEYAEAEAAWHAAVAGLRESISDKALPKKPVV